MQTKPTISACLIVKNEADNIRACLNSITPYVDEIIVCDTGSTDETVELCKRFDKVKLFHKKWNDNVADMRNYSLSKATSDYCWWVDGDEIVEKWQPITDEYDYYLAQYRLNDGERDFFGWQVRIFRNVPGIYFQYKRHAVVDGTVKGLKGAMVKTQIKTDYPGVEALENRVDRDIETFSNSEVPTANYHLACCYYSKRDWDKVIHYGRMALDGEINNGLKATMCIQIYNAFAAKGYWEPNFLKLSLSLIPFQVTARIPLAIEASKRGFTKLAEKLLNEAETICNNKQSQLLNDFLYTQAEFKNLRQQIRSS